MFEEWNTDLYGKSQPFKINLNSRKSAISRNAVKPNTDSSITARVGACSIAGLHAVIGVRLIETL